MGINKLKLFLKRLIKFYIHITLIKLECNTQKQYWLKINSLTIREVNVHVQVLSINPTSHGVSGSVAQRPPLKNI